MTISIIRLPNVPQLWDGCDVSIPEDEYHARLNRYLYEWRYRYESTVNTIIGLTSPLTTKGDVWGFSTVNARIPVGADGTVLTADSSATLGVSWKPDTGSDRWSWVFGSGYDGAFTADGSAAMPGASGPVANVYTLTRTVSFTDLTVNSGVTIYVAGKGVVLVKDTLTLNGNIEANGVLGRANYAADFYGTQSTGGGLATAGGAQGQALGGNGGAAGLLAGGGGVGGGAAGGTATVPPANWGGIAWSYLLQAILSGCGRSVGGGGYGGGAAGGGGTGGGFPGGNGGGCVAVLARIIDSSSTGSITANGGNGTNAIAANGGGGGGGGGGRVWLVTTTTNWSSYISLTANGGTGGNPNGTGNFGANGSAGTVASLILA